MFVNGMEQMKKLNAARREMSKVFFDGTACFSISQNFVFVKEG
jgi:hypothetical protein